MWFEHTIETIRLLPESKSGALPLGNTTILKSQQPLLIEERRSFILNYQASFLRTHCVFRVSLLYAAGNMRPISVVGFKMMVVGYGLYSENPTNFYISYLYHLFILQHLYSINLLQQVVLREIYIGLYDCPRRAGGHHFIRKRYLAVRMT